MKKPSRTIAFLRSICKKATTTYQSYSNIVDECVLINLKRIFYLAIIAFSMRLLDLFLFANAPSTSEVWHRGIMLSHAILAVFYVVVALLTSRLKKRVHVTHFMRILQYFVPLIIMASGVIIVTLDQLVTTNITPLIVVSLVFGAIFLIRPSVSILIYLATFFAYYHTIALTITNPEILLTNRVNGATILILGLLISIMSWHYNYTNISQKRRLNLQQEQLRQMAYYDPLTNLYNRHFFYETVEKELASVQHKGHVSALLILDLDNFKDINDLHGHLAGDQVLQQLAQLIEENVRKTDIVSRFGGEEFVILAPNTSLTEGRTLAEKLRRLIAEKIFMTDSGSTRITASFGVSTLRAKKSLGWENSFSLADKALYLAKKHGKNRVEIAS